MFSLGISDEDFVWNFYDKSLCFFPKGYRPESKISWGEIDQLLETWDSQDGSVSVYKGGRLPDSEFMQRYQDISEIRNRVLPGKIRELLQQGATLVLNRLDRRSTYFSDICQALSEFINEKVVANGYLASGGDGSFGKHWDTHDVFIIQLHGRKHWRVYKPTYELPLSKERSTHHKAECPTEPIIDRILEEGDVLYLPRGWWHEAVPIAGQETFHIAAGVHTTKVVDYFQWLCMQVLPHHKNFRKGLKVGFSDLNEAAIEVAANIALEQFKDPAALKQYMEAIGALRNRNRETFIPY